MSDVGAGDVDGKTVRGTPSPSIFMIASSISIASLVNCPFSEGLLASQRRIYVVCLLPAR